MLHVPICDLPERAHGPDSAPAPGALRLRRLAGGLCVACLLMLPAAAQLIRPATLDGGGGHASGSTRRLQGSMPGLGGNANAVGSGLRLQGGYVPVLAATLPLPQNAADPEWLHADPSNSPNP